jgi:hypothetical protein
MENQNARKVHKTCRCRLAKPTLSIDEFKVVEYSPSQRCFHVESMLDMIRCNQRVFMGLTMTDYLPIGLFRDESSLQKFLDKAHERLNRMTQAGEESGV